MKKWIWRALLVCLIGLIGFLAFRHLSRPDLEKNRGAALQELSNQVPPELKNLCTLIVIDYREYRANSVRWSAAYFGCIFGSAFLSALAGVVLKLESLAGKPALKNDLAASFAAVAALLITLSTLGNFQRNWAANRIAASKMENLAYELLKPETATDRNRILERIQEINEARNAGLVGEPTQNPEGNARPRSGGASETVPVPQASPRPSGPEGAV